MNTTVWEADLSRGEAEVLIKELGQEVFQPGQVVLVFRQKSKSDTSKCK